VDVAEAPSSLVEHDGAGWYVLRCGRVLGPYNAQQIARYMLLGRVRHNDRLSTDGECWQPVTDFPDLIPDALRDLDSRQGWEHYLDLLAVIDERRGEGRNSQIYDASERRRESNRRERFREDWQSTLRDAGLAGPERRWLPHVLLGVTLLVLLFLLLLNAVGDI
jgi:hypothetical protein